MNVPMADLAAQHRALKAELTAAFAQTLRTCDFGGLGKNTTTLETEIAALCGAQHGLGVNSGTDALLLALLALGIGPGDEVITTPFTFFATGEVIALAGATPVFADIDPQTYNLDPARAAEKITRQTKAILPVHLFGQMADMDAFAQIARERNVAIVGDGAQAIGATPARQADGRVGRPEHAVVLPDQEPRRLRRRRHDPDGRRRAGRSRSSCCASTGPAAGTSTRPSATARAWTAFRRRCCASRLRRLHDWNEARRRNAAHL